MLNEVIWKFPLPRTHTGMALGNATTGLLVWGEGNHLKITVGRADLWDNRGGLQWTDKQNYYDIKKHLETKDEAGIRDIFKVDTEGVPGQPQCPSVIPVGRIDLLLPEGSELKTGRIELKTAEASVKYRRLEVEYNIKINLAMESQQFIIEFDNEENTVIKPVPSWNFIGEYLESISFEPPVMLDEPNIIGWIQTLPENDGICTGLRRCDNTIIGVLERDDNADKMKSATITSLDKMEQQKGASLFNANTKWWENYWSCIPEIEVPNQIVDFCYSYGLYKFAGLTNPSGTAAGLQGAWVEEYDLPPWSNDYHFNINVQMCYWPAYKANRLNHLMPLFELVWSWREQLRINAKMFVGIDDGFMLPHAVDDKCTCMGSFWTGTIDHACAAWIAQMMYQYVQYSGDMEFLKNIAYPFMKGTMRVFEEMLEKDGDKYSLPVSVSPEYRGASMDAWGKNASFQLAAIHRLCEDLLSASNLLEEPSSPSWSDIKANLPQFTLIGEETNKRIALWDGVDLDESHRHHSHLGAICPFDTIDIFDPENVPLINNTIRHWTYRGTGLWSGWCVPWASMLQSRMRNGDMAETYLEMLYKVYMNEGYGTLHDCQIPGFSNMGCPEPLVNDPYGIKTKKREIMQIDAGMGAVVAVQDMLLHSRRGVVYIFPAIPMRWENASFTNMPCEGGFLISAELKNRQIELVKIKSTSDIRMTLRLANPCPGNNIEITTAKKKTLCKDNIQELTLQPGEECILIPCNR